MANVRIFTTPSCVYCKMAKEFFAKNNIAYEELDVIENDAAREEMIQKSHQLGVPVIDVNGEIFIGFDKPGIMRALGIGK